MRNKRLVRWGSWLILFAFTSVHAGGPAEAARVKLSLLQSAVDDYNANRKVTQKGILQIKKELKSEEAKEIWSAAGDLLEGTILPEASLDCSGKITFLGSESSMEMDYGTEGQIAFQLGSQKFVSSPDEVMEKVVQYAGSMLEILPEPESVSSTHFSIPFIADANAEGSDSKSSLPEEIMTTSQKKSAWTLFKRIFKRSKTQKSESEIAQMKVVELKKKKIGVQKKIEKETELKNKAIDTNWQYGFDASAQSKGGPLDTEYKDRLKSIRNKMTKVTGLQAAVFAGTTAGICATGVGCIAIAAIGAIGLLGMAAYLTYRYFEAKDQLIGGYERVKTIDRCTKNIGNLNREQNKINLEIQRLEKIKKSDE